MSENIASIMYTEQGAINTAVYGLQPEDVDDQLASRMILLRHEAWRVQFEEKAVPRHRLPQGAMTNHFRPFSFDSIEEYKNEIIYEIDALGSTVVALYASGSRLPDFKGAKEFDDGDLIAMARVRPISVAGRRDAFFEETTVHPLVQRQGLGSAAVHAALLIGNFDRDGRVSALSFTGDDGADAFLASGLGLEMRDDLDEPSYVLSDATGAIVDTLERVRYETPPKFGLEEVMQKLEDHKPWLRHYVPWPLPA